MRPCTSPRLTLQSVIHRVHHVCTIALPRQVDLSEARKTTQAQRSVASGLKDGNTLAEAPQILRRMYQPFKGPDLCHTDVVKCIVITDTGKIISGG